MKLFENIDSDSSVATLKVLGLMSPVSFFDDPPNMFFPVLIPKILSDLDVSKMDTLVDVVPENRDEASVVACGTAGEQMFKLSIPRTFCFSPSGFCVSLVWF